MFYVFNVVVVRVSVIRGMKEDVKGGWNVIMLGLFGRGTVLILEGGV